MIGLDTNILVRLLVEDDPLQARGARRLVEEAAARGEALRVDPIVLCEIAWVLRSAYRVPKARIVAALEGLLAAAEIEVGDEDAVRGALEDYRDGRGDLADYIIARRNRAAGCSTTATFDGVHRGDSLFRVLRTSR